MVVCNYVYIMMIEIIQNIYKTLLNSKLVFYTSDTFSVKVAGML